MTRSKKNPPEWNRGAILRAQAALEHIEEAQRELGRAQADLSVIIGGAGQWRTIGALYDRVHRQWYKTKDWLDKNASRIELDGMTRKPPMRSVPPACADHGDMVQSDDGEYFCTACSAEDG